MSDKQVEPITLAFAPGTAFYRLWGADRPCRFPDNGSEPASPDYFPPLGGFRFGIFTLAPDSETIPDEAGMQDLVRELNEKLPGLAEALEPDHFGMHKTATVDYEYVVSGRCVLELDDGKARELEPGDTVIQNGTRHAWRNPYDVPCVIVFVMIGAEHDKLQHR